MNNNNNIDNNNNNEDNHLITIHHALIQLQRENQVLVARIATLERNQLQLTRIIQTIVVLPEPEEFEQEETTETAQ